MLETIRYYLPWGYRNEYSEAAAQPSADAINSDPSRLIWQIAACVGLIAIATGVFQRYGRPLTEEEIKVRQLKGLNSGLKNAEINKLVSERVLQLPHLYNKDERQASTKMSNYFQQKQSMIMYFYDGGDLETLDKNALSIESKMGIARGMINGVAGFQKLNIIHRDLKPDNILFKKEMVNGREILVPYIADLGLAIHKPIQYELDGCGCRGVMSPEFYFKLESRFENPRKTDDFALGL